MTSEAVSATDLVGALPPGLRLHEYVIERVLGHGGFGITYLARDTNLQKLVAIKEYLPSDLAVRGQDTTVTVRASDVREAFKWGLDSFIKEARVLAKFSHPSLIQVHRYFEVNNTAYFVMDYAEGVTLASVFKLENTLPEQRIRKIIFPIMNGLEEVHRLGVLHRDIKPDNIILRPAGSLPVLIDFGAARQSLSAVTRSVMSVLTAGYAPIEQYASSGNQGPWTDLYAIGAVAYRALAGKKPVDAVNRIRDDPMVPAAMLGQGQYQKHFLQAVDWALAVNPEDRPKSVADLKRAMDGETAVPERISQRIRVGGAGLAPIVIPGGDAAADSDAPTRIAPGPELKAAGAKAFGLKYASFAIAALIVVAAVAYLGMRSVGTPERTPAPPLETAAAPPPVRPMPAEAASVEPTQKPETEAPASAEPAAVEPAQKPETEAPAPAEPAAVEPAQKPETGPSAPAKPTPSVRTEARLEAPTPAKEPADPTSRLAPAKPEPVPPASQPIEQAPARPPLTLVAQMSALSSFRDCADCPEMVVLAADSFEMGALPADNGNAWEGPAHTVRLAKAFAIGKHEVTTGEYQACVAARACTPVAPGPASGDPARAPVVNLNWSEANAYAGWLTKTTGRKYRLPSEAEWEYAIRAGTTSARYWGGDRTQQCRYGNGADRSVLKRDPGLPAVECDDGQPVLAPVGSFAPNAFGLFDMAGNAWEWTLDCWKDSYVGAPWDGRAVDEPNCTRRAIRGGSWRARPNSLRSFGRGTSPADARSEDLGLRVVAE